MLRLILFTLMLISPVYTANAADKADLWAFWDVRDENSALTVDHSVWQQFLDAYVSQNPDNINRVAYNRAGQDGAQRQLSAYLATLAALDPRTLNANQQLAYWINLYNALTVHTTLSYPDESSILSMGESWFRIGPWDDELITIAGQAVTLNDIEHRILRPIWQDHRVHFAVNCASFGCPNLNKMSFDSHNVEKLLAAGEQAYINHPRGVHISARGEVQVSSLFEWYQVDFADSEEELIDYLAAHHDSLGETLRDYQGDIEYDYDWRLNSLIER